MKLREHLHLSLTQLAAIVTCTILIIVVLHMVLPRSDTIEDVQALFDGSKELMVDMDIHVVHEIIGVPGTTELKMINSAVTYREFYMKKYKNILIGIAIEYKGYGTNDIKVRSYIIDINRDNEKIIILKDKPLTLDNI